MALQYVDQIDQGLARFYGLKKKKYDGVFKNQCEENGFDDNESIQEEMTSTVEESQLADDEFLEEICPWIQGDNRRQQIFEILLNCYKDKDAYSNSADLEVLQISEEHFTLSPDDLEKAKRIAQEQAPEIFNAGFSNDEVLCMMMAVNLKTKKNYMLYLVDMFLREAVYNHYNGSKQVFETAEWGQHNKHIKALNNINIGSSDKTAGQIATAAVKSYLHRVAPKVMLKSTCRIKGSLKNVSGYIHETVNYVHKMAKTHGTCPFQYDSVYAFQEKMEDDHKSDDEEEDDESDDANDDENDEKGDGDNESHLGDVEELLQQNKLEYKVDAWKIGANNRALDQSVKELGNSLKEKSYPRFNRFISIVDFRKLQNGDDPKLFVFNPQDGAGKVHKDPSALNFFHNSKKSILPDPNASDEVGSTQQLMTAASQGPQITLSFHVESEDSMRCYFYVNGQCTRFMPADLKMLLPLFFEDNQDNRDFANGDDIKRMIKDMQPKLKDAAFEAFLKKFKVECPVSKELQ